MARSPRASAGKATKGRSSQFSPRFAAASRANSLRRLTDSTPRRRLNVSPNRRKSEGLYRGAHCRPYFLPDGYQTAYPYFPSELVQRAATLSLAAPAPLPDAEPADELPLDQEEPEAPVSANKLTVSKAPADDAELRLTSLDAEPASPVDELPLDQEEPEAPVSANKLTVSKAPADDAELRLTSLDVEPASPAGEPPLDLEATPPLLSEEPSFHFEPGPAAPEPERPVPTNEPTVSEAPGGDAEPRLPPKSSIAAEASALDEPSAHEEEPSPNAKPVVSVSPADAPLLDPDAAPYDELRHAAAEAEAGPPVPANEPTVQPEPAEDVEGNLVILRMCYILGNLVILRMCYVLTVQAFARRWLAERSAIRIQSAFRGWSARNHYRATQIQRVIRGHEDVEPSPRRRSLGKRAAVVLAFVITVFLAWLASFGGDFNSGEQNNHLFKSANGRFNLPLGSGSEGGKTALTLIMVFSSSNTSTRYTSLPSGKGGKSGSGWPLSGKDGKSKSEGKSRNASLSVKSGKADLIFSKSRGEGMAKSAKKNGAKSFKSIPCLTPAPTGWPKKNSTDNLTEWQTKDLTESPTTNRTESPTKNLTEWQTKDLTESPTVNTTEHVVGDAGEQDPEDTGDVQEGLSNRNDDELQLMALRHLNSSCGMEICNGREADDTDTPGSESKGGVSSNNTSTVARACCVLPDCMELCRSQGERVCFATRTPHCTPSGSHHDDRLYENTRVRVHSKSTAAFVGTLVGGAAIFVCVLWAVWGIVRRRRRSGASDENANSGDDANGGAATGADGDASSIASASSGASNEDENCGDGGGLTDEHSERGDDKEGEETRSETSSDTGNVASDTQNVEDRKGVENDEPVSGPQMSETDTPLKDSSIGGPGSPQGSGPYFGGGGGDFDSVVDPEGAPTDGLSLNRSKDDDTASLDRRRSNLGDLEISGLDDESEKGKRKRAKGPKRMKKRRRIVIDNDATELTSDHMKNMLRDTSDIVLQNVPRLAELDGEEEEEASSYGSVCPALQKLPAERLLARPCIGDDGGLAPELLELWGRNTRRITGKAGTGLPFRMRGKIGSDYTPWMRAALERSSDEEDEDDDDNNNDGLPARAKQQGVAAEMLMEEEAQSVEERKGGENDERVLGSPLGSEPDFGGGRDVDFDEETSPLRFKFKAGNRVMVQCGKSGKRKRPHPATIKAASAATGKYSVTWDRRRETSDDIEESNIRQMTADEKKKHGDEGTEGKEKEAPMEEEIEFGGGNDPFEIDEEKSQTGSVASNTQNAKGQRRSKRLADQRLPEPNAKKPRRKRRRDPRIAPCTRCGEKKGDDQYTEGDNSGLCTRKGCMGLCGYRDLETGQLCTRRVRTGNPTNRRYKKHRHRFCREHGIPSTGQLKKKLWRKMAEVKAATDPTWECQLCGYEKQSGRVGEMTCRGGGPNEVDTLFEGELGCWEELKRETGNRKVGPPRRRMPQDGKDENDNWKKLQTG